MRLTRLSVLTLLALTTPALAQTAPPASPIKNVDDTYHGTKVTDPYRWLEDWDNADVKAWSDAQNTYARSILDNLPGVDKVRAAVTEVLSATSTSYSNLAYAGKPGSTKLFAMKRQPPMQQPFLVVMDAPSQPDKARVLVDPNTMNAKGTTAIDWFIPSPDGNLVAVSMSNGGSENGDLHIFDVATGKQVFEVIPHVQNGTGGGDMAWMPDGKAFLYTRYPRGSERPEADHEFYMQVYMHELGKPTESDTYELGKDFPKIAEITIESNDNGTALVCMQKGDGGEFQHYFRPLDGKWVQLTRYEDRVVQVLAGPSAEGTTAIYMVSRKDAPKGKVLCLTAGNHSPEPKTSLANAVVVIPEGKDSIVDDFGEEVGNIAATHDLLYVTYQLGGPSEVRVFNLKGKQLAGPKSFDIGAVTSIVPTHKGDTVLFSNVSYLNPPTWFSFDPATSATVKLPLSQTSPADFSAYEVVREMATSKDGTTKVPVNIIRKKGIKQDGTHPCMVTAYGGYGVNIAPSFRPANKVLLDQGIVIAEANIRGGGEFGEEWHSQGNLTKKQNVFDDFYAACHYMVEAKYTAHNKMVIQGGSNGGLLMGATFTQHPDVAKCVVSHVGIYDMLRVELSANGEFNITEFGTVKNPEHFKALYAYSPYHHVKEGTKYPAVLFLTGANDPRVDPMQSRKMTARLQAVGATTLLRTSANSGHGIGSSLNERIEQAVDLDSFIFSQLGIEFKAAK